MKLTKTVLKAILLESIKRDATKHKLKELAWAYVHGAPNGSADDLLYEKALIAKAKEMS